MVFLNISNLNQQQFSTSHGARPCQHIIMTITNGLLHHHGTLKKISAQLSKYQIHLFPSNKSIMNIDVTKPSVNRSKFHYLNISK